MDCGTNQCKLRLAFTKLDTWVNGFIKLLPNIIRLRWWTKSDKKSQIHVQDEVIQTVYQALDEAGIDMPYPTYVHLWHDQTDEFDGNRAMQRESWPAAKDKSRDARSIRELKKAPKPTDTFV
ncbi:mechanosensitive ion channel family protein [Psychrobacter sp. I-STPA10]|uniref:mechanosensitive ion channel family protein n=1 Tax=Psychrobacter sp. I-STPA10 TaxID=2585769 RepID=UPI001E4F235F|nr:mechanosensitive ion channel family protein [Psychrobacter sp. I-STPA10]